MSTIKSSDDHLTLSSDGSNKDIKFQANGVEKASISSSGAFTSTTIDATKLTGDLPAISGANLTGLSSFNPDGAVTINESGADVDFRVESDTNTNALLIDGATGNVGIGRSPLALLHLQATVPEIRFTYTGNSGYAHIKSNNNSELIFSAGTTDGQERMRITSDGRGLSQFTAKAWCRFNGGGTPSFSDSHNCSSIGDWGTGKYGIYMTTGPANANYAVVCLVNDAKYGSLDTSNTAPQGGRFDIEVRTVDSNFNAEDVGYVSCLVFGD